MPSQPSTLPFKRVEQVVRDGQVGWLKRTEQLQGRMRLQKGNANEAYLAERDALLRYADKGLPVPRLLEVREDYFVTADAGPVLTDVFAHADQAHRTQALCDAVKALALLHACGIAHGRPALKDICWEDGKVTFIDWERHREARNTDKGFAQDVILFFFSAITLNEGAGPMIEAAREVYKANAPPGLWPLAARRVRRLLWVRWVLSPVIRRLQSKREFRAVDPFFAFMSEPS